MKKLLHALMGVVISAVIMFPVVLIGQVPDPTYVGPGQRINALHKLEVISPRVRSSNSTTYGVTLTPTTLTANRTLTLPDLSLVLSGSASALTSGRVPFATTGGALVDDGDLTFATDTLTATKLVASTNVIVGGVADALNTTLINTSGLTFEGATADAHETVLYVTDPTADATFNLPALAAGTYSVTTSGTEETDGIVTLPALTHCRADNQTTAMIPLRAAAGDWGLSRTAAGAETQNIMCDLSFLTRSTASKGIKITNIDIIQQITVAALTSNSAPTLKAVTYANNVANSVANHGGTITVTMPTATQANPYVTDVALGTPAYFASDLTSLVLDWTVVQQNTGVYTLYGIRVAYSKINH